MGCMAIQLHLVLPYLLHLMKPRRQLRWHEQLQITTSCRGIQKGTSHAERKAATAHEQYNTHTVASLVTILMDPNITPLAKTVSSNSWA